MAWEGLYYYGGAEFINATRTETYAEAAGAHWFRPVYKVEDLHLMIGDLSYSTPLADDAPWADPDVPASYDFWGFYPLDVVGIEDSTRTSTVVESVQDGGTPGRMRHATTTIVFNVVGIGASDCAVEYGVRWLKRLLLGGPCGPGGVCTGDEMCYLACEPKMDPYAPDPLDCADHRVLHKVVFNSGPTVTAKRNISSDKGVCWTVQFTGVAANPYEYSLELPLIAGFMDPAVEMPYVPELPEGGLFDLDGFEQAQTSCAVPVVQPIFDPLCPSVIPPPGPPSVPLSCFTLPAEWVRREFTIPKQFVPLWDEAVPKIEVHARTDSLRNLRIRFYDDPFDGGLSLSDQCGFCGDMLITYVPENHTLVIDGSNETVYIISPGGTRRRADSLVFQSNGKPFEWPKLSCGFGYVVTLDLPAAQALPSVDLSLYARIA